MDYMLKFQNPVKSRPVCLLPDFQKCQILNGYKTCLKTVLTK